MANSLEADWWKAMLDAFQAQGIVVDPLAELHIKKVLANGVHHANHGANHGAGDPNDSVRELADALVRAGQRHPPKLSENDVEDAMTGICPLWPFC